MLLEYMSKVPEAAGGEVALMQPASHSCGSGGRVQGVQACATEAAHDHIAVEQALVDHVLPAAARSSIAAVASAACLVLAGMNSMHVW